MDGTFHKEAGAMPTNKAWLFAQALLGKPIGNAAVASTRGRADREQLEWLASISDRHEGEWRRLQSAAPEARREREELEWLASISDRHERELRRLLATEEETREAHERCERLVEGRQLQEAQWDPSKHPRRGGPPNAGWWATTFGGGSSGGGGSTGKWNHTGSDDNRDANGKARVPHRMLELAHAWWRTKDALDQARNDIEELPGRIASERAQLRFGGRAAPVHAHRAAKAQRDLETAKAIAPELEKQLVDLEQEYRDSGYDNVEYSAWTPAETIVGGRGIEQVGRAVAFRGAPAGLQSTGIEFDIVSAALAGPAILRLGKNLLGRAAAAADRTVATEVVALKPYGGIGGGHHIPAKSAFKGAAGYNLEAALAIPNEELARLNVRHAAISGAQKTLYSEFSKTGEGLTWTQVERIETDALVRAGVSPAVARSAVQRAIDALKSAGITGPTRIPWGN